MSFRQIIEQQFHGLAFERPLFYKYPLGLRFELSEGGSVLEQFLTALRKAGEICGAIFNASETITVCLRTTTDTNAFAHRAIMADLQKAGIFIPKKREIWLELMPKEDWFDETPMWWLNVAFLVPRALLENLLWCAVARDLTSIRPNPGCQIYLFNFEQALAIWPYDDRGMDVVGNDKATLRALYTQYSRYLLEYDKNKMDAAFAPIL
jgi:hypothetical protein